MPKIFYYRHYYKLHCECIFWQKNLLENIKLQKIIESILVSKENMFEGIISFKGHFG